MRIFGATATTVTIIRGRLLLLRQFRLLLLSLVQKENAKQSLLIRLQLPMMMRGMMMMMMMGNGCRFCFCCCSSAARTKYHSASVTRKV